MAGAGIIETVAGMQSWSEEHRRAGRIVGCVPTMGFLHEGHLSLIRECAKRADAVAMTLFVNPAQFGPGEDLEEYPRDFQGDCDKAHREGAHAVFHPPVDEMYPKGFQTHVAVEELTADMEGEFRPTHFRGVTTVVAKLINAVRPHLAVFGEKDFQQLKVIERMARDLDMGVSIIGAPTVRDPDGMAASSRNVHLSPEGRKQALSISRALFAAREAAQKGENSVRALVERARGAIEEAGLAIDYVEIRDDKTLGPVEDMERPARMLIAARLGKTRLIDNMALF